jgi:glutaredoxin 3
VFLVPARETVLQGEPGAFEEINVVRDQDAALDLVRKTGQTGVPVIKIGSNWIVGFDKQRIEKELARRAS